MKFPVLECSRLVLRPMASTDVEDVFAVGGDDEVMRTYDWDTFRDTSEVLEFIDNQLRRFESGLGTRWGMALDGKVIGWCGFTPKGQGRAEIGYALARSHWGQGFATEALDAVVSFVFESTDLHRLEAVTHRHNAGSARVLEKCGFQQEGLLRQYGFWRGEYHDMIMHSLLRSEH